MGSNFCNEIFSFTFIMLKNLRKILHNRKVPVVREYCIQDARQLVKAFEILSFAKREVTLTLNLVKIN